MTELRIKIEQRFSDNFGDPISQLANYVRLVNENSESEEFIFDFEKCRFLSPFVLCGLASLIDYLKLSGKEIKITENNYSQSYLNTIYFPQSYPTPELSLEKIETDLMPYHTKTYIPIVGFPTTKETISNQIREKTLTAIYSILRNQLNLNGNILNGIQYFIDELTQNVSDHSRSHKGFLFAQYYPSKNYLDLSIVDNGRGLKQSYLDSGYYQLSTDEEAIRYALNGESTKISERSSRGFGIPTTKRMLIEGLRGKIFLWSGISFFHQNTEKEGIVDLPASYFWQGCMIAMRIPIFNNDNFNFYKFVE